MHRILIAGIVPGALFSVGIATAAPVTVPGLSPLPLTLPTRCEPLAHVPASATIPGPLLAAHVSVANCVAEVAMNELALSPDSSSIARLNAAVEPSVALLDSVILVGDPYWSVIALDAKRDLYVAMTVRERDSIHHGDLAGHDALEIELAPWQAKASLATAAIADIRRSNPGLPNEMP